MPPPLSLQILGIIHLWQRPPVATGTPPHRFSPCPALQATGAHTSVTMVKFSFSSSEYLPIFCCPHSSGPFPGGSSLCLAQGQAWHPWLPPFWARKEADCDFVAMTSAFPWQNSISLCPASFSTPRQIFLLLQVFLDFLLLHSSPL